MDLLVNACDPDREGEAIFRRIIHHAGVNKPTRRLWVASLEEEAIRQALAAMKPEGDYRGLADSAMIRAKADWLIDMNASRAYSLVYNTRFTVGRVQTPTLAMIVERDRQIESHKPTPFWKVVAPMGSWTLTGTHLENHGTAEALLEIVNQPDFAFGIYAVKRHRQHDAPPRLYDLTNLQKDMSKLHGLTAAHTLTALQSLYEQRLTTYPRTDSRFITHDDLDALRKLTNGDRLASGFLDPAVRPAQPRLELTVNDAKVTGHTAILPTLQASGETLGQLGDDKRLVLTRVVRRMWEAVADDHVHDVTLVSPTSTPITMKAIRTSYGSAKRIPVSPAAPTRPSPSDGRASNPRRPKSMTAGKTRRTPRRATSFPSTSPPERTPCRCHAAEPDSWRGR